MFDVERRFMRSARYIPCHTCLRLTRPEAGVRVDSGQDYSQASTDSCAKLDKGPAADIIRVASDRAWQHVDRLLVEFEPDTEYVEAAIEHVLSLGLGLVRQRADHFVFARIEATR